jgi:hypothetical protein
MGSELVPCIECPCTDVRFPSRWLLDGADEKDRASMARASAFIGAAAASTTILRLRRSRVGEAREEVSLVGTGMADMVGSRLLRRASDRYGSEARAVTGGLPTQVCIE